MPPSSAPTKPTMLYAHLHHDGNAYTGGYRVVPRTTPPVGVLEIEGLPVLRPYIPTGPVPEHDPETHYPERSVTISPEAVTEEWILFERTEEDRAMWINAQAEAHDSGLDAAQARRILRPLLDALPEEEQIELADLYPAYRVGVQYQTDDRFHWQGSLYKVLQGHTSSLEWRPDEAVSLYVRATPPGEIPEWVQPQGAHDAYQIGDRVTHAGETWESTVASNTWEPGVHGWIEVTP